VKITATVILDTTNQTFQLYMSEPAQRAYLAQVHGQQETARAVAAEHEAALMRTYHLGNKPTPGRGYDDRLKMRLGCGSDLAREVVTSGRIAHQYLGNRYSISEQAVRDFYTTKGRESA
jgi:hypothetical protein